MVVFLHGRKIHIVKGRTHDNIPLNLQKRGDPPESTKFARGRSAMSFTIAAFDGRLTLRVVEDQAVEIDLLGLPEAFVVTEEERPTPDDRPSKLPPN
jgi:hypothetical protein